MITIYRTGEQGLEVLEEITKGGKLTDTEAKELAGIFADVAGHRAARPPAGQWKCR